MALTVTTDLTNITTAESTTGWNEVGTQSAALEPDFYVQGSNCISRAVSNTTKGMLFEIGTALDFTSGTDQDKLVYIWIKVNTPQLADTRANGGLRVRLATTSVSSNYREWFVAGSDSLPDTEGWICYVIDPQSAGTQDSGTYDPASVLWFGATLKTTASAKGQNLGIDRISYGRGELLVEGTVTTAGEGFKEVAEWDYDASQTNRWGIISIRSGVIFVKGKIVIGDASTNTTFSSYGEQVVFETPTYYDGTDVVKAIPDASEGGTTGADGKDSYLGLGFIGGATTTNIDLGLIVGTDSGRSGPTFNVPLQQDLSTDGRTLATVTVDNSTMSLDLYGAAFSGFEGPIDLTGTGVLGDDCFACTFDGCGRIESNMEWRNCNILNSAAAATDGALLWDDATDVEDSLFAGNSRAVVFESSTGTPFTFSGLVFSGNTFDVRNEITGANITINYGTGALPTKEDVSTSVTTLTGSVSVSVTVTHEGSPVEGAAVYLETTGATVVLNGLTNASGVLAGAFSGTTPATIDADVSGVKFSSGPIPYEYFNLGGTIEAVTGYSTTVLLGED